MKMRLMIDKTSATFLAVLLETLDAIQAEKEDATEHDGFVERFPDFESVDLEDIRDRAAAILAQRRGDKEAAKVFDKFFPPCRHFRSRDGDEWKMPTNGERGQLKMAKRDLWEPSSSSLKDFIDRDTGEARPGYSELGEGRDCGLPFKRSLNGPAWEIAQKEVKVIEPESPEDYNSRKQAEYNDDQVSS